jgi:hypothetical protein
MFRVKNKPALLKTKATRKLQRSTPLSSYLAITAGVGAVTLINADGAIIYYNGPAVTVTSEKPYNHIWWSPDTMEAGLATGKGVDRFNFKYAGVNYVYSDKNEGMLDLFLGTSGNVPLKLAANATIDASINWFSNTWAYMNQPGWTTAQSPWATGEDGTRGFIPFSFRYFANPAETYYGWADFTYNDASGSLVLNNFAYNDTPNAAITTGGGPVPAPEPGQVASGLLLLALGGAKVLLARRRRKETQAAA